MSNPRSIATHPIYRKAISTSVSLLSYFSFVDGEAVAAWLMIELPKLIEKYGPIGLYCYDLPGLKIGDVCVVLGDIKKVHTIVGFGLHGPDRPYFLLETGCTEEVAKCHDHPTQTPKGQTKMSNRNRIPMFDANNVLQPDHPLVADVAAHLHVVLSRLADLLSHIATDNIILPRDTVGGFATAFLGLQSPLNTVITKASDAPGAKVFWCATAFLTSTHQGFDHLFLKADHDYGPLKRAVEALEKAAKAAFKEIAEQESIATATRALKGWNEKTVGRDDPATPKLANSGVAEIILQCFSQCPTPPKTLEEAADMLRGRDLSWIGKSKICSSAFCPDFQPTKEIKT